MEASEEVEKEGDVEEGAIAASPKKSDEPRDADRVNDMDMERSMTFEDALASSDDEDPEEENEEEKDEDENENGDTQEDQAADNADTVSIHQWLDNIKSGYGERFGHLLEALV